LLIQRSARGEPVDFLAGDLSDPVVIGVVVEDSDTSRFGCSGNQQIRMLHRAVVKASFPCELLVDLEPTLPLRLADRAVGQRTQIAAEGFELAGAAGAIQQLQAHHVTGRDLALNDRFVELPPDIAADRPRPAPGAGVRQLHLSKLPRTADLAQGCGCQTGKVLSGEPPARCPVNDLAQRRVDRLSGLSSPQHRGSLIDELLIEVDVGPLRRPSSHATSIHLSQGPGYTPRTGVLSNYPRGARIWDAAGLSRPARARPILYPRRAFGQNERPLAGVAATRVVGELLPYGANPLVSP